MSSCSIPLPDLPAGFPSNDCNCTHRVDESLLRRGRPLGPAAQGTVRHSLTSYLTPLGPLGSSLHFTPSLPPDLWPGPHAPAADGLVYAPVVGDSASNLLASFASGRAAVGPIPSRCPPPLLPALTSSPDSSLPSCLSLPPLEFSARLVPPLPGLHKDRSVSSSLLPFHRLSVGASNTRFWPPTGPPHLGFASLTGLSDASRFYTAPLLPISIGPHSGSVPGEELSRCQLDASVAMPDAAATAMMARIPEEVSCNFSLPDAAPMASGCYGPREQGSSEADDRPSLYSSVSVAGLEASGTRPVDAALDNTVQRDGARIRPLDSHDSTREWLNWKEGHFGSVTGLESIKGRGQGDQIKLTLGEAESRNYGELRFFMRRKVGFRGISCFMIVEFTSISSESVPSEDDDGFLSTSRRLALLEHSC
ncbi:unnamed protein product [Protopolystoma xenopodis]|uniref:Uncharacterized protein n=1 Tax=Protopolystoma xenopodis TaxID=117903 RepID=A0A3S5FCX5_9PLAT|nr:unnamed protein product [Protopolystoma xenopodis]